MNPQIIRHGEVLLVPVETIPTGATPVTTTEKYIVAHSETGHHHVLQLAEPLLAVYEHDGQTYLDVQGTGQLVHEKTGPDVHKTHVVAPAKYKVVIKQAFDYFAKKLTQVRD